MATLAGGAEAGRHDLWLARGVSILAHALLLGLLSIPMLKPSSKETVLLTVETVGGYTPLGEGTGTEGTHPEVNNQPANANPLAGAMQLKQDEIASPRPKAAKASKPAPQRPSAEALAKEHEAMPIGLNARQSRESGDLSEGGMGNNRKAGAPDGLVGVTGQIGGRGFAPPDLKYPGPIPEETELQVYVVVNPQGDVLEARLEKSAGYPELNQFALGRAREFRFDPLTPAESQENKTGILYFKFQYQGVSVKN